MRSLRPILLPLLFVAATASAAEQPPVLDTEHLHASGAFSFRTPASWALAEVPGEPEAVQASGDGMLVRFVYRPGEWGRDSLHGICMLERLAGRMDMYPNVDYEYDFLTGKVGAFDVIDSAFLVAYDAPVMGELVWRQRNVTMVGNGQSLCAISYAPARLWKKSKTARQLLDGVLGSVHFK